jgi:hypothetical protein
MSELVPATEIEEIVGVQRHLTMHYARAVSAEQTVYILHSQTCRDSGRDLRECPFSLALDKGIAAEDWDGREDEPVRVAIHLSGRLVPAAAGGAHHFVIRTHLGPGPRPCGECRLPYDQGDHIEITDLNPYTHYVCPNDVGGLGHSSRWTGAYRPDGRQLRDKYCICGAELVEEDAEQWRLSWEMVTPGDPEWRPVTKTASRHATHQQHAGLLKLIEQGEQIRNVQLVRAS